MRFGVGRSAPIVRSTAQLGITTNGPVCCTPGVAAIFPTTRNGTKVTPMSSLGPLARTPLVPGEASTGTGPLAAGPAGSASEPAGNSEAGVWPISAAYWRGSTTTTPNVVPSAAEPDVTLRVTTRLTPGTAAMARAVAGVSGALASEVSMTASAPTWRQDCAMSPSTTAVRSIAPNATTASASTRANAGSTAVIEVRVARAIPTNVVTPDLRPSKPTSQRSSTG